MNFWYPDGELMGPILWKGQVARGSGTAFHWYIRLLLPLAEDNMSKLALCHKDYNISPTCPSHRCVSNFFTARPLGVEAWTCWKALNGNSLIFAHPSILNNGKPIGYRHPIFGPCIASILKVDRWANIKEFPFRAFGRTRNVDHTNTTLKQISPITISTIIPRSRR